MTKKSAKQRKEITQQLELAKKKLSWIETDKSALAKMHELKLNPEYYKPGKDFEERMVYQTLPEFLENARIRDEMKANFEMAQIDEQIDYYEKEVKRLNDELKERD